METVRALASNFDDIRILLLFYWVEAAFIAYAGMGLLGIKTDTRKVIKIGILHGLAVFVIRALYKIFGIPFGTHTLILVFVMAFLISRFILLPFGISLTASLLGIVTLLLGESLLMPFFFKMLQMPVEDIWANPWTHVMAGYVGDSLLIFVVLIVALTNFSLLRLKD